MKCTGDDMNAQPVGESPHTDKVFSSSIVSDFSHKSKAVFMIVDLAHHDILETLQVNYIIFDAVDAVDNLTDEEINDLKEILKGFTPFFISTNQEDFIGSLKLYKKHFQKIVKRLHLIDLETLKATELITADELAENDYPIGVTLPTPFTFKDYHDEVKEEGRHEPQALSTYLKTLLTIETERRLQHG